MTSKKLLWIPLVAALALALAAQAQVKLPPMDPPVSLKVGSLEITADAGIVIGLEKGYYKEEGIQVELERFDTAAKQVAPLAAGHLHVGVGAISAGLFNAVARAIPIKAVAEKGSAFKGRSASALVIRKDLVDSGRFKDYPDFKGMTIAVSARGTSPHVQLGKALERGRLTEEDIKLVPMAFANMPAAFQNKAIDAAVFQEPLTTISVERGLIVLWKLAYDLYPNHTVAVLLYGPALTEKYSEAAKRFLVPYLKSVREYNEAFLKGKNKKEVVSILIKYTQVKQPALYEKMVPAGLDSNGQMNLEGMAYDQEWYAAQGMIPKKIDIKQLVDLQYLEYAWKRIGRVEE